MLVRSLQQGCMGGSPGLISMAFDGASPYRKVTLQARLSRYSCPLCAEEMSISKIDSDLLNAAVTET